MFTTLSRYYFICSSKDKAYFKQPSTRPRVKFSSTSCPHNWMFMWLKHFIYLILRWWKNYWMHTRKVSDNFLRIIICALTLSLFASHKSCTTRLIKTASADIPPNEHAEIAYENFGKKRTCRFHSNGLVLTYYVNARKNNEFKCLDGGCVLH